MKIVTLYLCKLFKNLIKILWYLYFFCVICIIFESNLIFIGRVRRGKLTVFLNYSFSFMSSGFVVVFSCERFLTIAPFRNVSERTKLKPKIVLTFLVILAVFYYSHLAVTSGIEDYSGNSSVPLERCVTLEKWFDLVRFSALVDSAIAIILPILVIAIMNFLLALKLVRLSRGLHSSSQQFSYLTCVYTHNGKASIPTIRTNNNRENLESAIAFMLSKSQKQIRVNNYMKSIKSLFLVTMWLLLLNTPIAICKIRYSAQSIRSMVASFIITNELVGGDDYESADTVNLYDELAERVTCYIYYLNFCLNFAIYFPKIKKLKQVCRGFSCSTRTESILQIRNNKYGTFAQSRLKSDSFSLQTF